MQPFVQPAKIQFLRSLKTYGVQKNTMKMFQSSVKRLTVMCQWTEGRAALCHPLSLHANLDTKSLISASKSFLSFGFSEFK